MVMQYKKKKLPVQCCLLPFQWISKYIPKLSLKPKPISPVHSFSKFSAVFGKSSPKSPSTIRPALSPPMVTSKNTFFVTEAFKGSSDDEVAALALGDLIFSAGVAMIHKAAPIKPAVMRLLKRPRRVTASTIPPGDNAIRLPRGVRLTLTARTRRADRGRP